MFSTNQCGIVHIYNASGNRTKRVYFCNNGGQYPSTSKMVESSKEEIGLTSGDEVVFQPVESINPNPPTGRFTVYFSKALQNATVTIANLQGSVLETFKARGGKLECNIYSQPAGMYLVTVREDGRQWTFKGAEAVTGYIWQFPAYPMPC